MYIRKTINNSVDTMNETTEVNMCKPSSAYVHAHSKSHFSSSTSLPQTLE